MPKKKGDWPETGFGQRLKELREAKGWTAEQLAENSGCHPMTISKLERGIQSPAWPLVLALCKALGVSCQDFIIDGVVIAEEPKRGRPKKEASAEAPPVEAKKRGRPRKKS